MSWTKSGDEDKTKEEPFVPAARMHLNLISEDQQTHARLSSGCRIPNLAHSMEYTSSSLVRVRGEGGGLARFSCPCADTKRLLIKSALADPVDSLSIRVCGVTARARRDRLAWSGFSPVPGKMGERATPDRVLEEDADITEKKGHSSAQYVQ